MFGVESELWPTSVEKILPTLSTEAKSVAYEDLILRLYCNMEAARCAVMSLALTAESAMERPLEKRRAGYNTNQ